jgi:hypothetical protein
MGIPASNPEPVNYEKRIDKMPGKVQFKKFDE